MHRLRILLALLVLAACGGRAAPPAPPPTEPDVVAALIAELERGLETEAMPSLQAAGALGFYGDDPRAAPALVRCLRAKGDMSELGAECGASLERIGPPAVEHLRPLVDADPSSQFAFRVLAAALDHRDIGVIVPYYLAACRRMRAAPSHRDEHIIDAARRALAEARLFSLPALEQTTATDPIERACLAEAVEAIREGSWSDDE